MSNFYIVKMNPNGDPVPAPEAGTFESSQEAAAKAKALTAQTNIKHQPRRMAQADTESWKKREAGRLKDGTYKPFPKSWATLSFPENHFTHISPKNPTMIAFFVDIESGILDKPTETKPGRYLQQYLGLDTSGEQAKALIADIDALSGVQFAMTRADVKKVYENGPTSCMAHKASYWPYGGIHPAELYAAGDLAVAYLVDEKAKEFKCTARVVCWPEKKIYGRLYGDTARLQKLLAEQGYKAVGEFPEGVRFNKLEHPTEKNKYIAPYLDNFPVMLKEKDDHFITLSSSTRPETLKGQTILARDGYGFWSASRICPKLGNAQPLGDGWTMVRGVEEEWSPTAVRNHTFRCGKTKEIWPAEDKYRIIVGGTMYARSIAKELGIFKCSVTGFDYLRSELHSEEGGKFVSKAGHTFLERKRQIEEEKAKTRKRVEEDRKRWMAEMELVKETADEALGIEPKRPASNHHVVFGEVQARPRRAGRTIFSGHGGMAYAAGNNEERLEQ